MNEQQIKINQLKLDRELIPITVKIPAKKYRVLMNIAKEAQVESLKFFNGEMPLDCDKCPMMFFQSHCGIKNLSYKNAALAKVACYGAFMRFLFSED